MEPFKPEHYCSCGVRLVEGARFCHKCGKPVAGFEPAPDSEPEVEIVALPPPVAKTEAAPPVLAGSFHDGRAIRVAAMLGAFALGVELLLQAVLRSAGLQFIIGAVVCGGAGWLAVRQYVRRGGTIADTGAGARIGWITGLFAFLGKFLLFTVSAALLSQQGGLVEVLKKSSQMQGMPQESIDKMNELLAEPGVIAVMILLAVVFVFVMTALPASYGGIIGARGQLRAGNAPGGPTPPPEK